MKHAITLVLLAACGGDGIAPTLRFTPLEDDDVTRLVAAAMGGDSTRAIHAFETHASSSCPAVTQDGPVTTLTGDCETADSFPVSGVARRVVEPDAIRYDFEAFVVPINGARLSVDGAVELTHKLPPNVYYKDEYREHESDLLIEDGDRVVRSTLHFTCERDLGCRTNERTFRPTTNAIELVGRGGALVSGRIDQSMDGDMTLQGVDTVEIFMVRQLRDCLHWRIAGTDRSVAPFGCPR